MSNFPVDLLTEIFLLLPAKTLLRFKVVCKLWYHLITDLDFVNLHLQRSLATKTNLHFVVKTTKLHLTDFDTFENILELDYSFKYPDHSVDVVGTCNGLLCLMEYKYFQLIIYNPTTQTNRLLPWLSRGEQLAYPNGHFNYGFGFDTVSQDYKCVRIGQTYSNDPNSYYCEVMIYSLNNHSWRRGPDVPHFFYDHYKSNALLHETIHWVGAGVGDDRVPRPIITFSLQDENFNSLTLPQIDVERYYICLNVQVLDGCLCVLVSYLYDCDVWIMEEYGVAGSWKKVFNVVKHESIEHLERIVSYSSSGKGLFVRICLLQVAYLDLETMMTTNVKVADFVRCLDAHLCVENLLMLDLDKYVYAEDEHQRKNKGKKKSKKKRRNKKRNSRH